ncbi:MAG: hypothetical protein P1U74_00270 [Legionellaceae bacterium]|nr:hypothetical protein [Legionellaceae bacterium]
MQSQSLINPIEKLKVLTQQELERLNKQKHNMESVHSNLDLLIKRYNIEKSYIGQITHWYGARPWWAKILLFLLTASIGACIGMICHIPIILAVCAGLVYIFFAFFFINHYQVTQKQTNSLCEDIIELEKSLGVTINHFNELSNSLKDIFKELYEMNKKMLENIQLLETNISDLSSKINIYKQIVAQLYEAKDSLINATSKVSQELLISSNHYHECQQMLADGADSICKLNDHKKIATPRLEQDTQSINALVDKYHRATLQISATAKKMTALLAVIQNKVSPTMLDKVSSSQHSDTDISDMLSQSDELITTTKQLILETSAAIQNNHQDKSEQTLEKARQTRMESSAIRNKVSSLITSPKKRPCEMYRFLS